MLTSAQGHIVSIQVSPGNRDDQKQETVNYICYVYNFNTDI